MDAKALKEAGKFVLRMTVFALPLLADTLLNSGKTELAALVSALLAVLDKYIHESDLTDRNGLTSF